MARNKEKEIEQTRGKTERENDRENDIVECVSSVDVGLHPAGGLLLSQCIRHCRSFSYRSPPSPVCLIMGSTITSSCRRFLFKPRCKRYIILISAISRGSLHVGVCMCRQALMAEWFDSGFSLETRNHLQLSMLMLCIHLQCRAGVA